MFFSSTGFSKNVVAGIWRFLWEFFESFFWRHIQDSYQYLKWSILYLFLKIASCKDLPLKHLRRSWIPFIVLLWIKISNNFKLKFWKYWKLVITQKFCKSCWNKSQTGNFLENLNTRLGRTLLMRTMFVKKGYILLFYRADSCFYNCWNIEFVYNKVFNSLSFICESVFKFLLTMSLTTDHSTTFSHVSYLS